MKKREDRAPSPVKSRWKRRFRNLAIASLLIFLFACWMISDHVRTLQSLKQIDGTNVYVMDYYANYDMDEIFREGIDVDDIEGTYIDALFPQLIAPVARVLKSTIVPEDIKKVESNGNHHCSSVARYSKVGRTLFGRNFDSYNDAILVLRIHKGGKVDSISVIDLEYLNLNRDDLLETSLVDRIPLLFAPYYVMDGMNHHGLAVSAMSVPKAKAPCIDGAPKMTQASMMRLILDYCESVEEAVELMGKYNISFVGNPEHLMVVDSTGKMAVVEFIDGDVRVTNSNENWLVCTNHLLWSKSEEENDLFCDRYRSGSDAIAAASHQSDDESFASAVHAMSVDNWTMWTSLYDLNRLTAKVMYKSNRKLSYLDRSMSKSGSENRSSLIH